MKERPILFSGPMVRAILEGRKTQTRRIVKPQPPAGCAYVMDDFLSFAYCVESAYLQSHVTPTPSTKNHVVHCPYGKPGDRLWVRETWGMSFEDIVPKGRQFVSGGTW